MTAVPKNVFQFTKPCNIQNECQVKTRNVYSARCGAETGNWEYYTKTPHKLLLIDFKMKIILPCYFP